MTRSLSGINPQSIVQYLELQGWKSAPSPSDRLLVFTGPDDDFGRSIELVLPTRNDFNDSESLIDSALELAAATEGNTKAELVQKMEARPIIESKIGWLALLAQIRELTIKGVRFASPIAAVIIALALVAAGLWYFSSHIVPAIPPVTGVLPRISEYVGLVTTLALFTMIFGELQADFSASSHYLRYASFIVFALVAICLYALTAESHPFLSRMLMWQGIVLPTLLAVFLTFQYRIQSRRETSGFYLQIPLLIAADVAVLLVIALFEIR